MAKRLREAEEIRVTANVAGVPVSFTRNGRRETICCNETTNLFYL